MARERMVRFHLTESKDNETDIRDEKSSTRPRSTAFKLHDSTSWKPKMEEISRHNFDSMLNQKIITKSQSELIILRLQKSRVVM